MSQQRRDPPSAMEGAPSRRRSHVPIPFPFIVGCGRSGTTLLRMILDSHSQLAIPDESNFVPTIAKGYLGRQGDQFDHDAFIGSLFQHRSIRRWHISEDDVRAAFEADPPADVASAIRAAFAAYARKNGKTRYGDKTPRYVLDLAFLADLFPEARFIHVIRDGRDVALSFSEVDFGPRTIAEAASFWRARIEAGRTVGRALGPDRYREIRYEDLLDDVRGSAVSLCEFVDLSFEDQMLRYFERPEVEKASTVFWKYSRVALPPTKRLRDWRSEMPSSDLEMFEAIAGDVLESLGYERATSPVPRRVPLAVRTARLKRRLRLAVRSAMRSPISVAPGRSPRTLPARQMISEPSIERSEVTSWAIARRAEEDADVRIFRERHLAEGVVPLDDVARWIDQNASVGGASETVVIEYIDAAGRGRRSVAATSAAAALRDLGLELATRYDWTDEQASTFILTGLAPRVPLIRSHVRHGSMFAATTRVVLDVDPGLAGREVWKRYRRMQRGLGASRFRKPDAKALTLALFAMRPGEGGSVSRWNEEHPQWRYADPREFDRESRLALRRLLEPPW